MGIEGSQFCTNPLPPSPCRCSMRLTSPLEHPCRNSRFSLTQAHLTCGYPLFCTSPACCEYRHPVPGPSFTCPATMFPPLTPDDTHLLCLQLHTLGSDIFSLPPSGLPIRPSGSPMDLGELKELLLMTQFG